MQFNIVLLHRFQSRLLKISENFKHVFVKIGAIFAKLCVMARTAKYKFYEINRLTLSLSYLAV